MNKRKAWRLISFNLLLCVVLCEVSARLFGTFFLHTPFLRPQLVILNYYPELSPFLLHKIAEDDTTAKRMLILGGSAVTNRLCGLEDRLNFALNEQTGAKKSKIYNLSEYAQTSWDSRIKLEYLQGFHFDFIFVYDGINDTRANNCPTEVFRNDYSHIEFYNEVQTIRRHPYMGYFALPYFIDRTWQRIKQKLGWQHFIPKEYFVLNERLVDKELTEQKDSVNSPGWRLYNELAKNKDKVVGVPIQDVNSQWISDGSDIKSAVPFRQNYEALVAIANKMKARLILSTYAYYLPVDYSLEKFLYQKLDYTEQRWPVEIYGLPNNVVKGLNATNEIIRKLHTVNPALLYFDFENAIPHNGQYFNDICHLTSMGCSLLTDSLAVKIRNE